MNIVVEEQLVGVGNKHHSMIKEKQTIKGVHVRCMDERGTARSHFAVEKTVGGPVKLYELTAPGGAGVLNGLMGEDDKKIMLRNIGICLTSLSCAMVCLSVHGTSHEDGCGCGGYILSGYKDEFSTPERSRIFLTAELRAAASVVREKFPGVTVRAFYVTFAKNGDNIAEEISS